MITSPVTTGPIVRRIVATGTLQAVTTLQVGAQVSGTIQSLGADYNSIVRTGQVLARLDPAVFQATLDEAQAMLARARAAEAQAEADRLGLATAVDDARMKLIRAEELAAGEIIPQADLDAARIAMDQAVANLRSGESQVGQAAAAVKEAAAAVDQAKVNLEHTVIVSPIKVVRLQPVIEQTGSTTATASTSAAAPPIASNGAVIGYATIIDVMNPGEKLRPGMTATVTLDGSRRGSAVRLPNNALAFRPPPEVLQAVKQTTEFPAMTVESTDTAVRRVWRFDGAQFTPIDVRVGLADTLWTEP